jgi:hypothetical protein
MEFNLTSYLFLGSVPIIVGLVQIFKLWIQDTRIYPIIAIVLGVIINICIALATNVFSTGSEIASSVVMGIIAGLSAAGLYSGATSGK